MGTTLIENQSERPAFTILDQGASLQGVDANTSNIAAAAQWVSVEGLADTEVAQVQVRIHPNASWEVMQELTGTPTVSTGLVDLEGRLNFARVVVTTPVSGAVKAFAQK